MAKKSVAPVKVMESARRGRKPVNPNETKAERFDRLCGIRLRKTWKLLKGIKNCSNTVVYDYTPKQVSFMVGSLRKRIDAIENAYKNPTTSKNGIAKPVAKIRSAFEDMS